MKRKLKQQLFEVFTATFDQFNASLLNKSIKIVLLALTFWTVVCDIKNIGYLLMLYHIYLYILHVVHEFCEASEYCFHPAFIPMSVSLHLLFILSLFFVFL